MLYYRGLLASTVDGEVILEAMYQGSVTPLVALSLQEAKSEILALSRDS